jgi:hypothetical protein
VTGRRIAVALACVTGAALVAAFALQLGGGSSASGPGSEAKGSRAAGQPAGSPPAPTPAEERLAAALRGGVERAARLGGQVEAAAMLDGSAAPIVASSEPGGADRPMRMWSISKVATMVALLRLLGWGESAGRALRPEVASALEGALIRSENCRQRRVVLELQRAAGGISAARSAFAEVFSLAGAAAVPGSQVEAPELLCVPFLEEQREIPEPLEPALLLGTSRWRVADAARLAHALAVGLYGRAISIPALGLMRAPKLPSRESEPGELTAPPDWGAGSVFFGLNPAYKAGWGGSLNGNFMAGQIAVVPLGGGDHLALAVMFHTDAQPSRDDPGITTAPEAVEAVMEAARASVFRSDGQQRAPAPSGGFTGDD